MLFSLFTIAITVFVQAADFLSDSGRCRESRRFDDSHPALTSRLTDPNQTGGISQCNGRRTARHCACYALLFINFDDNLSQMPALTEILNQLRDFIKSVGAINNRANLSLFQKFGNLV
jgi:hypothetical protein